MSGAAAMQSQVGSPSHVLVVDDDELALMALEAHCLALGYSVSCAKSGQEALQYFSTNGADAADVVLLDRQMPQMDGLAVVRKLKAEPRFKDVPIVMITGSDDPEQVREGIEAGVFYYLTKPADRKLLASVVSSAVRQTQDMRHLRKEGDESLGFDLLEAAKFKFRTLREADSLAGFVANIFPDPDRSISGISALLTNAIEHGLCGIGFETKAELLNDGNWREEVDRRCKLLDEGVSASLSVKKSSDGVVIVVTDPGEGFDWRNYMEIDVARTKGSHGRGIVRARSLAFESLKFNEQGNQVAAFSKPRETLDW